MSSNPVMNAVTFEVIRNRLVAIAEEMRIALQSVSGSPTVTEASDFFTGLFLPDGSVASMGFQVALTPFNLMVALAGLLLGIIVGILPGLGGANGCAILIPVTFVITNNAVYRQVKLVRKAVLGNYPLDEQHDGEVHQRTSVLGCTGRAVWVRRWRCCSSTGASTGVSGRS